MAVESSIQSHTPQMQVNNNNTVETKVTSESQVISKPKASKTSKTKAVVESEPGQDSLLTNDMMVINAVDVLGCNDKLDELAQLVLANVQSILSHTYNPNNNTFVLDYVIRRITTNCIGLEGLRLFPINWDVMMSKCPPKNMLRPSERVDYQYPIYEFPPDTLPDGQRGFVIDFQKMRYKTYPIILALIEYLVSSRSFVTQNRKILIIIYHMELCLTGYYYKFAQLLERYPEKHYYWILHGGTETPTLHRHKMSAMMHYYPIRMDLPSQINKSVLVQIIWDLTDKDILKTWILSENINTIDDLIYALPLCQILTEYIHGLKAIKHMNDMTACYRVAYKINTLGYSIARLGRTLISMLKWHRHTKTTIQFAPDFTILASDRNWIKIIKIFADYETYKYSDKTEQIPIFQNIIIDLALIQLNGQ